MASDQEPLSRAAVFETVRAALAQLDPPALAGEGAG